MFQTKPKGRTLIHIIFISTSLHVSGNYVPVVRRNYCIYATLVFFTVYGWLSGLPTDQTATHTQTVCNCLASFDTHIKSSAILMTPPHAATFIVFHYSLKHRQLTDLVVATDFFLSV